MQELVHDNSNHAEFQLFDLSVTDLIKLVQSKSDKVVKFAKMFNW